MRGRIPSSDCVLSQTLPMENPTWRYIFDGVSLHLSLIEYTFNRILAGDFEEHCDILSKSHKGFTTWATLPQVENTTFAPALDSANETSVFQHCFPTLLRVLSVIDAHARARPHLRALHVLHDGAWDHPTVYLQYYKLEAALMHPGRALAAGWTGGPMTRITHSGMLPMRWGEADWAVTVDVELARNAEVFIGNGFSSLSTQVLALRLGADGGRTEDITLL